MGLKEITQPPWKEEFCQHGKTLEIERINKIFQHSWVGEGTTIAKRPWKVSPPILGGLGYGDLMVSDTFPLAWGSL